jgi:hypothetical protein
MRLGLVTALAALTVVPLAGCSGTLSIGDDGEESHQLEVRGTRTAFSVEVPDDWGITDVWDASRCGSVSYRVAQASSQRLLVEAVPTSCAEAAENTQVGNGFHGVYRTLDDVPEPKGKATVTTGLGEAVVFTQKYFECTNSCDDWAEPVAIITLDSPVDPAYPTLVVRGEKDTVSRADLEDIVASLEPPYVPAG